MKNKINKPKWLIAIGTMRNRNYWNKANTVEFAAFMTKIIIIFPGLIFGIQWWWLYVIALITSAALVWSSTVKTLPTIIILNLVWIVISIISILKEFL